MAEIKYNHECLVCGTKYKSCNNCIKMKDFQEYENSLNGKFDLNEYCKRNNISQDEKQNLFFGFRSVADTFECYLVFMLIKKIKKSEITKEQAKIELEQLGFGMEEIKNFKESVRDFLLNYFDDENMQEAPAIIEEEIKLQEPISEVIELENTQEQSNLPISRRRKYNV